MSQTKAQLIDNLVQALNFTGTASAPANGLFLSATNTLQLSTASTPRLTINSDGHVDVVGNLDVGAGIDVTGNITATGAVDAVGITIGGNTPSLSFNDANDDPDFRFLVNSNSFILEDTTNSANRLVVNSDGHVDITGNLDVGAGIDVTGSSTMDGTVTINANSTTPALHLQGTGPQIIRLADESSESNGMDLVFRTSPNTIGFETTDNATSKFAVNYNGQVTITDNLDVGAGLDVTGAITASTSITATGNLVTNGNLTVQTSNPNIFLTDTDNNSDFRISNSNGLLEIRDITNSTTRFCIKSDGNVGIGTTAPAGKLNIVDTSNDGAISQLLKLGNNSSGAGTGAGLQLGAGSGNAGNSALLAGFYDGTGTSFTISTCTTFGGAQSEKLRVTNSGFVGIGTTSPSTKLHVNGDITAANSIVSENLSGRNFLINGAMQINQRGASLNLTYYNPVTSSIYTLDRWKVMNGSSFDTDSAHISKSTQSPDGFSSSMKWDIGNTETPSANQNCGIEQKIEGHNLQGLAYGTSSAKTMTLSFHVYSNKTGTYCVHIMQEDGTKYQMHEYTISSSNTWEKKTITIVGNTSNAINNDNSTGLRIIWVLTVGSGDTVAATSTWASGGDLAGTSNQVNLWDNSSNHWYLTGCQLEVGTIATEFEHIDYSDEIARCQRYYFKVVDGATTSETLGFTGMVWQQNNGSIISIRYPVKMRATPSLEVTNGTQYWRHFSGNDLAGAYADGNGIGTNITREFGAEIYVNVSANTGGEGRGVFIRGNNSASKMAYGAEL